jgi:uncharacterized protein (TIGR03435 family)
MRRMLFLMCARRAWPILSGTLGLVSTLLGQTPPGEMSKPAPYLPSMTFEVASIRQTKPNLQGWITVSGGFNPPDSSHLSVENNDLRNLLSLAYPTEVHHDIDGLRKLSRELQWAMFDVTAKADAETDERLAKLSKEQLRLEQAHMVQTMLAERFNLKAHWETRDGPTYELVVTKPGKLKSTGAPPREQERKAFGDRGIPPLYQQGDSRYGFHFIAHEAKLADIVSMLAGQFGEPVRDMTGLTGMYDFDLTYYETRASDRADDETNAWAPLEIAIQDQLGLKLVPSHGLVQVLVVDHVEFPTEN